MRKRLLLLLSLVLLLAVGVLATLLLWPRDDGPVSRARCKRVQAGMTQAEVEAVLGGPPGDYRTGEATEDHRKINEFQIVRALAGC